MPSEFTCNRLHQHAQNWRGITASEPWCPPPIAIQQLSAEDVAVWPSSYAIHTMQPIPSDYLITPFISTITPSAVPPQWVRSPQHANTICPPHQSSSSILLSMHVSQATRHGPSIADADPMPCYIMLSASRRTEKNTMSLITMRQCCHSQSLPRETLRQMRKSF
jgi:hypothetical protein